jgi:GNT-I family
VLTVAFTVTNRPGYLAQVLESWSRVRDIGDAHLIFRCEPGCPETVALCEAVDFAPHTVTVNPRRLGVLANPWHALDDGFKRGDFTVLAEDDLIVSFDVLEYFTWCAQRYRDDPEVLAVTTYQREAQPGRYAAVRPVNWELDDGWHFWVWGTWADRWARLRPDWDFTYAHKGWDWRIRDHWVLGQGLKIMAPAMSRSQHIGRDGGTHASAEQYQALLSRCFYAGVRPQHYHDQEEPDGA